jgi:hypothetical protein
VTTTYPTLAEFLICDDVRRELGNKISLIGVYVGDGVKLIGASYPHMFPQLTFYCRFRGGSGRVTSTFSLTDPNGHVVHKTPPQVATIVPGEPFLVVAQIVGLAFLKGHYTFTVELDSQTYVNSVDFT